MKVTLGEPRPEPGVLVEHDDGVLRLVLNRPARKNALDPASVRLMVTALEAAATDDNLRVVVVESRGPDFCSGADWVASNADGGQRPRTGSVQRRTALQAHRLVQLVTEVQLPVVCVVRGHAAGLGCQLALAADFTVASETSSFWEPFLERGFSPDSGATWLLPRLVGIARAKELLLLGRKLTGAEAAEWGLVYRAVPDADLDAAVAGIGSTWSFHSGQICTSPTRVLVHRSVHDALVSKLAAYAALLPVGDPREPKNVVGPLISASQRDRVERLHRPAGGRDAEYVGGGRSVESFVEERRHGADDW
nr:aldehyde dehydrogenase family protein [Micromonospora sp. DSM 115978]